VANTAAIDYCLSTELKARFTAQVLQRTMNALMQVEEGTLVVVGLVVGMCYTVVDLLFFLFSSVVVVVVQAHPCRSCSCGS